MIPVVSAACNEGSQEMSPDDTTREVKSARTAMPIRVADAGCGLDRGRHRDGTGTAQLVAGASSLDSPLGRGGSVTVSPTPAASAGVASKDRHNASRSPRSR